MQFAWQVKVVIGDKITFCEIALNDSRNQHRPTVLKMSVFSSNQFFHFFYCSFRYKQPNYWYWGLSFSLDKQDLLPCVSWSAVMMSKQLASCGGHSDKTFRLYIRESISLILISHTSLTNVFGSHLLSALNSHVIYP